MSTPALVAVDRADHTVVVRLQNPPVNAWTAAFTDAMETALVQVRRDPGRAVVLTGQGRHFSAGGDIAGFTGMTDLAHARQFVARAQGLMDQVAQLPVPVIAAINGTALGGGLELALACDIRIATPEASLGLPETRWGILAGAGGTQRLARLVGPGAAKLMMFTARPVSGRQALALGLVDRVSADPVAEALELADAIAVNSPRAVRHVKRCVDEGLDLPLVDGLSLERRLWADLIPHGDLQEGARAFFGRREPSYPDLAPEPDAD